MIASMENTPIIIVAHETKSVTWICYIMRSICYESN